MLDYEVHLSDNKGQTASLRGAISKPAFDRFLERCLTNPDVKVTGYWWSERPVEEEPQ